MPPWGEKKGTARPPAVSVAALLTPQTILFADPAWGKTVLLDALIARVCARHGLADKDAIAAKVREREQGISTTLDTGVSLPHARVDGLSVVVGALGVARTPIVEPAQDEIPVRAVFLFFSPNKDAMAQAHLQILRAVAILFTPALLDALAAAKTPEAALAVIRAAEGPKD